MCIETKMDCETVYKFPVVLSEDGGSNIGCRKVRTLTSYGMFYFSFYFVLRSGFRGISENDLKLPILCCTYIDVANIFLYFSFFQK